MTFRLVDTGWGAEFESALCMDRSELRIVCPFIKARALDRLLAVSPPNVRVITRYNLNDFARRVSDIATLRTLLGRGASIRGIRNLHAKLYVFGQSRAIVTSANLTNWALTYPAGKRPRQVKDGDVMFIALLTNEPDIRVFGRAFASKHEPGRDDATHDEIRQRPWKDRWPHYIRVDQAEFLNGTIANGVSLNELMQALGADSFASTQENAAQRAGNTDPRSAYKRQAAVKLSPQGCAWLSERLQAAFDEHGTIPRNKLKKLDWPD